jgi:hypothetical protein
MSWITHEMQAIEMADKRLTKRLTNILEAFSENAEESIPAACQGWNETKSVYRFFDNPRVTLEDILSGHKSATIERIAQQQMVLLAQDTTFLNFEKEEAAGVGTLKRTQSDHYLLHPTVAFTPSRDNLGVLGGKLWQRQEENVAHLRGKKPIEEKESYRWLESYELACQVQQQCPDTLILSVADREGDIHEWFLLAQNKPIEERAELLVRAKCNRRTQKENGEYSYLWDEMAESPVLSKLTIKTPRHGNKPSRIAVLDIKAKEIEFCGRKGKNTDPVYIHAVYAKEKKPPKGEKAIEWMLLTSLPIETAQAAETVIQWYCARWEIEIYFRVLKQGCQVEELRLETDHRLFNCLSIYLIVAWRIHTITMQSREYPDQPCDTLFNEREWKTIYLMAQKKKPPKKPPTLRDASRMLAQLGGFLARKGDGDPGVKNIWRGYRALQNYVDALDMAEVAM